MSLKLRENGLLVPKPELCYTQSLHVCGLNSPVSIFCYVHILKHTKAFNIFLQETQICERQVYLLTEHHLNLRPVLTVCLIPANMQTAEKEKHV